MKALFLNENLGGHATVHANLRRVFEGRSDVHADFVDVPWPSFGRKVFSHTVPGLSRLDLDFQSLRFQVAASAAARPIVKRAMSSHELLHVYSHTAAWMFPDLLRAMPSIVATDSTHTQNMAFRDYRRTSVGTELSGRPIALLERRVLQAATTVVAQSEWTARALKDLGVPEDRLEIVRYGVPVAAEPIVRRPGALPEFVYVGRNMERKGGNLLLDVFCAQFSGRARLNLVTHEAVPPRGPDVIVHSDVHPGDPRLQEIFARSVAFVLPTEVDKSPNAVIEAMGAGLPVISTEQGGIPEMVIEGECGYLVPPRDARALAAAMERILADPERSVRMGREAHVRARELFELGVTTRALIRVMQMTRDKWSSGRERHRRDGSIR